MSIKILHFHNSSGGGVLSVIRNLFIHRQNNELENHVIYTICRETKSAYKSPLLKGASSETIFTYSTKWNFYHTCRTLSKLLPDSNVVLVAHDSLELGMVSNLGLNYPVVQFVHGDYDYYYQLAERYEKWIDCFICVSASIAETLRKRMPHRNSAIHYLRFPVPTIQGLRDDGQKLQLIFIGRCEPAKGYNLLPLIDAALQKKNINAHWHIVGPGSELPELQDQWQNAQVTFHGELAQEEIKQLLLQSTAIVLPSYAEGMPVSIVEAMKAGVIPVVNDLIGGLQELIINDKTGYLIADNDPAIFAERLSEIAAVAEKRNTMSSAAMDFVNFNFDPLINTSLIEELIVNTFNHSNSKKAIKTTGSRLDQPWIPNIFTTTIRFFIQ